MVMKQNMASGDHTISGNPADYYVAPTAGTDISYPASDSTNRGVGGRIMTRNTPNMAGTPAMWGVPIAYPNSNVDNIQNSTNDGMSRTPVGASGAKIGQRAPQRHPVNGVNPMKPIQRK
jgi:hypothetical protein